jgi:hypothetical protein
VTTISSSPKGDTSASPSLLPPYYEIEKIILLRLPPHSMHFLQPLDVVDFQHSPSQMTLIGLPSYFQAIPPTLSTSIGDINTGESLSKVTFYTTGWTSDEQAQFLSLVNHLHQLNETLTGFVREQASLTSWPWRHY